MPESSYSSGWIRVKFGVDFEFEVEKGHKSLCSPLLLISWLKSLLLPFESTVPFVTVVPRGEELTHMI